MNKTIKQTTTKGNHIMTSPTEKQLCKLSGKLLIKTT